jgi:microcystin-dependent protein
MASPYIGEIRMFGGNFAPNGWAFCDGQLIPIAENDALFTLIGTTYGGDGEETFALPDLRGRFPIHQGQGPGLSNNYILGENGGVEQVTLTLNQIPVHTHTPLASSSGGSDNPENSFWAHSILGKPYAASPSVVQMNPGTINLSGGSQPHENMIPFCCISYIISLFGVFPTQS